MAAVDYDRSLEARTPSETAERRLAALWAGEGGLRGWLSTVDHKEYGKRYIATAFLFLAFGGIEALIMRLQLAGPNRRLLTPEQYDQLFSMHGLTMIFLYAQPVLSGFSVFLFPLILGTRDMAFPRLNAFSYWMYLFSGLFIYAGFPMGYGPNDGWFNYVPYALKLYNPGPNIDIYALGMILFGVSSTAGATNFVVTFLRARAPGMSINRVPSKEIMPGYGVEHPAPHRGLASDALLFTAPLAWAAQLLLSYGLSSHACFPRGLPKAAPGPGWEWLHAGLLAINLAALAIALLATAVSYALWRRTRAAGPWRVAAFVLGLLSLALVTAPPVADWSERLFSTHMAQHLALMLIAVLVFVVSAALALLLGWLREADRRAPRRWPGAGLALIGGVSLALTLSSCDDATGGAFGAAPAPLVETGGDPRKGAADIAAIGCGACHTIPGVNGAAGLVGPPLNRLGRRVYIAGLLRNTPENLQAWLRDPQKIVPGNVMPNMGLTEEQTRDIAAYLYTLQ